MQGRAFLNVARHVASRATEEDRRAAVIHAYYALFLECRDALIRWGFRIPRQQSVHSYVRFRFLNATDADLRRIGDFLEDLFRDRSRASYELISTTGFTTDTWPDKRWRGLPGHSSRPTLSAWHPCYR